MSAVYKQLTDEERRCESNARRRQEEERQALKVLGPGIMPWAEEQNYLNALVPYVGWSVDERLTDDELEAVINLFFAGIDIEVERKNGPTRPFNIYFATLPKVKHMDVGTDPTTVEPQRQVILVHASDTHFYAESCTFSGPAMALAFGLCHRVRRLVSQRRENPRDQWYRLIPP